jgi:predicted transcriptional regulator
MPKRRNPYIKANLDEIGTAAWELIDGKRKVEEIVRLLTEKLLETETSVEQLEQRLCVFIQQLNANKFITFIEFMEK